MMAPEEKAVPSPQLIVAVKLLAGRAALEVVNVATVAFVSGRPSTALMVVPVAVSVLVGTHGENSEVFPFTSVAVAVSTFPGGTPTGSVAVNVPGPPFFTNEPRNVCPSPLPEASHTGLLKNPMV